MVALCVVSVLRFRRDMSVVLDRLAFAAVSCVYVCLRVLCHGSFGGYDLRAVDMAGPVF